MAAQRVGARRLRRRCFLSWAGCVFRECLREVRTARKCVLESCPFNEEHKAPDAAVFQRANGQIGFKCLHASCAHKHWADVRERFEPQREYWSETREEPARAQPHVSPSLPEWPAPLDEKAYYGVAGELVRLLEPHTESDPAAPLVSIPYLR